MKSSNFSFESEPESSSLRVEDKVQISDKVQSSRIKIWGLMFGYSLGFDVWPLNFTACGQAVQKFGKSAGKLSDLYPKSTALPKYLTGQGFFVRRPCTDGRALGTGCASRLWQNLSVKYSYTRCTQGLLMKIN